MKMLHLDIEREQIPFRNDRQKGKGKGRGKGKGKRKYNSRFPSGMTDRKARATAKAKENTTSDSLQE